jgi:hypothetical protein
MRNMNPAVRKVIYIVLIGILIIPLAAIALPQIKRDGTAASSRGGVLAGLREEYGLSQAQLGEIDPASEAMKLASLGLRGVAVCSQWMKAMEFKKTENYDQLASTLRTLTKLQPNFVKVWEYQAHNLAYNVSMEFDDYEYRYHWVKKGIGFLKEGVPYNRFDHRMTDNLGFFIGNKIGKSDEKDSFRRMFGYDTEFHDEMSDYVDPDTYETRSYGHDYDNWLLAYQWYDYSRRMVEEFSLNKYRRDIVFYANMPTARRSQGLSLQREFRPDESQKEVWRLAEDEWKRYGDTEMSNSLGVRFTIEELYRVEEQLQKLRNELDEMVPGMRQMLVTKYSQENNFPEDAVAAWRLPLEQRDDRQLEQARLVEDALQRLDYEMDIRISRSVDSDNVFRARQIVSEIEFLKIKMTSIEKDAQTINYGFWKSRTRAESSDLGLIARQALFDAEQARLGAVYEDELDRDYKTGEVTVIRPGALSLYLDAFEKFAEVLKENRTLGKDSPYADEIVDELKEYQKILKLTGRDWPEKFPLQGMIDARALSGLRDGFPTTVEIEELRPPRPEDLEHELLETVIMSEETDKDK